MSSEPNTSQRSARHRRPGRGRGHRPGRQLDLGRQRGPLGAAAQRRARRWLRPRHAAPMPTARGERRRRQRRARRGGERRRPAGGLAARVRRPARRHRLPRGTTTAARWSPATTTAEAAPDPTDRAPTPAAPDPGRADRAARARAARAAAGPTTARAMAAATTEAGATTGGFGSLCTHDVQDEPHPSRPTRLTRTAGLPHRSDRLYQPSKRGGTKIGQTANAPGSGLGRVIQMGAARQTSRMAHAVTPAGRARVPGRGPLLRRGVRGLGTARARTTSGALAPLGADGPRRAGRPRDRGDRGDGGGLRLASQRRALPRGSRCRASHGRRRMGPRGALASQRVRALSAFTADVYGERADRGRRAWCPSARWRPASYFEPWMLGVEVPGGLHAGGRDGPGSRGRRHAGGARGQRAHAVGARPTPAPRARRPTAHLPARRRPSGARSPGVRQAGRRAARRRARTATAILTWCCSPTVPATAPGTSTACWPGAWASRS